jgi:hypothetical protein
MRFDMAIAVLAVGVSSLASAACGGESGGGTGGGSTTTTTTQTGPSGSGWGTHQSNSTCADAPLFTPGTKMDGEVCADTGECAPACCPCPSGGSYWSYSCQKGLCVGDGNCAATQAEACK